MKISGEADHDHAKDAHTKDAHTDADKLMAARKLPPDVRATRIAELEAELKLLNAPPYVEYPKVLPDGRTVNSAEEEKTALEPAKKEPPPKK